MPIRTNLSVYCNPDSKLLKFEASPRQEQHSTVASSVYNLVWTFGIAKTHRIHKSEALLSVLAASLGEAQLVETSLRWHFLNNQGRKWTKWWELDSILGLLCVLCVAGWYTQRNGFLLLAELNVMRLYLKNLLISSVLAIYIFLVAS